MAWVTGGLVWPPPDPPGFPPPHAARLERASARTVERTSKLDMVDLPGGDHRMAGRDGEIGRAFRAAHNRHDLYGFVWRGLTIAGAAGTPSCEADAEEQTPWRRSAPIGISTASCSIRARTRVG